MKKMIIWIIVIFIGWTIFVNLISHAMWFGFKWGIPIALVFVLVLYNKKKVSDE